MLSCFKGRFRSFADTTVTTNNDIDSRQIVSSSSVRIFLSRYLHVVVSVTCLLQKYDLRIKNIERLYFILKKKYIITKSDIQLCYSTCSLRALMKIPCPHT